MTILGARPGNFGAIFPSQSDVLTTRRSPTISQFGWRKTAFGLSHARALLAPFVSSVSAVSRDLQMALLADSRTAFAAQCIGVVEQGPVNSPR